MKLTYAKRLHNHDQVTVKETGETVEVIAAYPQDEAGKVWLVDAMTGDGFKTLTHLDIA